MGGGCRTPASPRPGEKGCWSCDGKCRVDARGGGGGGAEGWWSACPLVSCSLEPLDPRCFADSWNTHRHNIVFEIWRQRTMDDIAILYKGTHQYSASRRVQVGGRAVVRTR